MFWIHDGPGTGHPAQRLREQDQDGVDAEILYTHPSYINSWRGISDDEPYRELIRAYNSWLIEEYCSFAPDRLLAMGVIPDTAIDDAVAELEYCARAGFKGVKYIDLDEHKVFDPTPAIRLVKETLGGIGK